MEAENKNIDQFTAKVLKDAGLETPSLDFLANVMEEVSKEKATIKAYKPLISKVGWFTIAALFFVFGFVLWRFSLGVSIIGDWNLSSLLAKKYDLNVTIPRTYAYCFFFLLVFVIIQVNVIKKQFEKNFESTI